MKRFSFSLETARRWREAQSIQEEAKYRTLAAAAVAAERRLSSLRASGFEQRRLLVSGPETDGAKLALLHGYTTYVAMSSIRLEAECAKLARELAEQLERLNEARRALELLERIRKKEHAQWRSEMEREIQGMADDAYNARLFARTSRKPSLARDAP